MTQATATRCLTEEELWLSTLDFNAISRNGLAVLNSELAGGITGDKISATTTITAGSGNDVAVLDGADATYRIYAGHATPGSAPFRVTKDGALTATSATITGNVTIQGGSGIGNLSDAGALAVLNVIGNAYITDLSCDKLNAGTLTARCYRTASSGRRIQIHGSGYDHTLVAVDGYGAIVAEIRTVGGAGGVVTSSLKGFSTANPCALDMCIGRFDYLGSQVYNGNAPSAAWTDLDLSSYIGSRRALVLLQIENNGGVDTNYRFRMNGSGAVQYPEANAAPGVFSCKCDTGAEHNYVWVITDANGVIEWDADAASSTVVTLLAYIN